LNSAQDLRHMQKLPSLRQCTDHQEPLSSFHLAQLTLAGRDICRVYTTMTPSLFAPAHQPPPPTLPPLHSRFAFVHYSSPNLPLMFLDIKICVMSVLQPRFCGTVVCRQKISSVQAATRYRCAAIRYQVCRQPQDIGVPPQDIKCAGSHKISVCRHKISSVQATTRYRCAATRYQVCRKPQDIGVPSRGTNCGATRLQVRRH
jgi:hypothetical protein